MTAPLLESDTVLRELTAGEAPYEGTLCAGEPAVVWVDAGALLPEVWDAPAEGHLLVPWDIARTADGHRAAMPHCPARLVDRLGGGDGAAVTVAVSIVRAADAADALGVSRGSWWVDDAGRPVLALGGAADWRPAAVTLLEAVAATASDGVAGAVARAVQALGDEETVGRAVPACEEALFAAAAPGPLIETEQAAWSSGVASRRRDAGAVSGPVPLLHGLIARHVDAALADRVAGVVGRVRERWRPAPRVGAGARRRSRRDARDRRPAESPETARRSKRPALVGVTVAVTIAVGGLLWPDGGTPSSGSEPAGAATVQAGDSPHPPEPSSAAASPADAPEDGVSQSDPAENGVSENGSSQDVSAETSDEAMMRVVDALATCASDGTCEGLWEAPDREPPVGAATTAAAGRSAVLLDDYGGVRAVRVDAEDAVSQVVVIVRHDDEWLVREIYDLAHQP